MTITLTNGTSSTVIAEKGAELKSYIKSDGRELMWCADPNFWGKTSPVLFPMIGMLKNNKTIINGKEYTIGKHGFARDNDFISEKISENCAVFTFKSNKETLEIFPFEFVFKMTYTLYAEKLEVSYEVTNKSDTDMPFCIGAHPAFSCGDLNNSRLVFENKENVNSPIMNLETRMWGDSNRITRLEKSDTYNLDYRLFDNDCVYFDSITSKSVQLIDGNNNTVKVSWEGFTTLGVWTPAGMNAKFVCIEPWCGCDDYDTDNGIFADKRGIQTAKPNETKKYLMIIE